jgi:hypothetical protein
MDSWLRAGRELKKIVSYKRSRRRVSSVTESQFMTNTAGSVRGEV